MDRGVNILFTSLSTCKIRKFLSIIAWRDFSKGCYVTTYGIPFILWCLSLLFNLSWKTFFISELIRSSGCSIFQNHNFIYSLWFSKPFSDVHNLLIRGVSPCFPPFCLLVLLSLCWKIFYEKQKLHISKKRKVFSKDSGMKLNKHI